MRYIFRPGLFDYDNDIEKVMPTTLVKTCWDKLQNNTYSVSPVSLTNRETVAMLNDYFPLLLSSFL